MNKIILKIEFKSEKSLEMTLVFVDSRLLTKDNNNFVYFNSNNYDFVLYSSEKMKRGINSLRIPSADVYKDKKNRKATFEFNNEKEMYQWLKKLHTTLNECNNNFTPFVNDGFYDSRLKKVMLSGEYWII